MNTKEWEALLEKLIVDRWKGWSPKWIDYLSDPRGEVMHRQLDISGACVRYLCVSRSLAVPIRDGQVTTEWEAVDLNYLSWPSWHAPKAMCHTL